MKIVKRGTPPKDTVFAGTCFQCKSDLECTRDELPSYNPGDYRSEGEFGHADCPVCGYRVCFHPKETKE